MIKPDQTRLPGSIRILCEAAPEFGVSAEECLAETGLTLFELYDPATKVTIGQELTAIENFLRHKPYEPGMGIGIGRRIRPETLGIWGYALLSSPTFRASLSTAMDYARLSFMIARMDLVEQGEEALITFDTSPLPQELRKFVLERHLTVLFNFASVLLPASLAAATTLRTMEYDEGFATALNRELGLIVESSDRMNAVVIPRSLLDLPLPQHDPEKLAVCLKQCEALQGSGTQDTWTAQVQDAILSDISNAPTIKSVAETLKTSDRTLARRLAEEGSSFRTILVRVRLAIAHELLTTTSLSVSKVAWRAGYAEPSSFVRAFTKEYGYTPGKAGRNI
ncbi:MULTISPECIES: AraC family transcriptional regulator [unclassified Ruegeria]|uniref:AraC family transcriptional regulator n=1 Tax=unclassified Ruegeria TaxID=2625375 RepID=UPI001ADA7FA4|nr:MULTISPECIES: AraC family transcriptional regulator [unclassified Ruegeria]MBO9413574.1 AraC family transcriptional regulator ligand-binding domain-containing protein [Ruegeria sp. R8_1]MBO9417243.1 AraC family transcriptional regulator ligand-binding domain-containing protein [Ruegeria sp. R8_2]